MDSMIVKGLGRADGSYPIQLLELVSLSSADALTTRELNAIRVSTARSTGGIGTRPGELVDAVVNADAATMIALAAVLLARNGKAVPEDRIWDCHILFSGGAEPPPLDNYPKAILFHVLDLDDEETEAGAADPPQPPETTGE